MTSFAINVVAKKKSIYLTFGISVLSFIFFKELLFERRLIWYKNGQDHRAHWASNGTAEKSNRTCWLQKLKTRKTKLLEQTQLRKWPLYIKVWCLPVMVVNQKIRSYPVIENNHKEFDDPFVFLTYLQSISYR